MYRLQTMQRFEPRQINSNRGALKMDKIDFDFTLDNIICVKAPKNTDPDTLHEELKAKLQQLINDKCVEFIFEGTFEH